MASTLTILTPENVEVTYELGGLATRIVGAFLDTVLQLTAISVVWMLLFFLQIGAHLEWGTWLIGGGILLTFAIFVGYFLLFEALWNGQTPGKKAVGLRVMKDAGFPIDLRSAVVRNVVRLLDFLPGTYAIGIASAFFSTEYKRLGDYAAGTLVIRERPRPARLESIPLPEEAPVAQEARSGLPRADELHAIRHFLNRRADLAPEIRAAFARRLALAFGRLLGYPLDQVAAGPEAFLQWLVDEAVRREGVG